MFLTVHAPAGALVGAFAPDPVSAFVLGVLSHAVLDIIPHGDEAIGPPCAGQTCTHREEVRLMLRLAIADAALMGIVLATILTPWRALPSFSVLAGIAGGVLPAILQGLGMAFPRIRPLARFKELHDVVHCRIIPYDPPFRCGIIVQVAALALIIALFV